MERTNVWLLEQANTILGAILGIIVTVGALATQAKKIRNFLLGDLIADLRQTRLAILRVEILTNIYNTPERAAAIEELYEEYQRLGGNHYIKGVMDAWRETYERGVLVKRISQGRETNA